MPMRRRDFMAYACTAALPLAAASQAPAAWPAKPITLVVPFPAGGTAVSYTHLTLPTIYSV